MLNILDYVQCDEKQLRNKLRDRLGLHTVSEIMGEDIYIWGIGALGQFVVEQFKKNGLKVKGILTSDTKQIGMNYEGIPFVSLDCLKVEDMIVVCSMAYPVIAEKLSYKGYKKYFYYEVLPFLFDELDSFYMGFDGMWETLTKYRQEVRNLQEIFAHDEVSQEVLSNVLLYRYTFETAYLDKAFLVSLERGSIYFDRSIVKLSDHEVFVDCGGYTGDTVESFILHSHNRYKKIFLFEPDNAILKTAQENLKGYQNISFFNEGIGKTKSKLFFEEKGSIGGGTVSFQGKTEIIITSLDEAIKDFDPTYIKMDIEGSEMDALRGAVKTVSSCRPKMAISVYHHPYDIVEITEYMQKLLLDYEFYLRHYSRMYDDTVLYCIPKKK
ncbi:MAG: FkbM family methyltransferase [Roseburia sp.]|nr:FkbM family methyltransferase [Roseburia sp.]